MSIKVLKRDNNEQIGALVCMSGIGTTAQIGPFNLEGKLIVTYGQVDLTNSGVTTTTGGGPTDLGMATIASGGVVTVESLVDESSVYLDFNINTQDGMRFTAAPNLEWSFTNGAITEVV